MDYPTDHTNNLTEGAYLMPGLDNSLLNGLSKELSDILLPSIKKTIEEEISRQLSPLFSQEDSDSIFFKSLTEELMGKISAIYQEIHTLQKDPNRENPGNHEQVEEAAGMVTDASQKLHQIISQTEKATFDILDRVDRSMETIDSIRHTVNVSICDETAKQEISRLVHIINDDLLGITTGMSFQDLTGQRIKRVIEMLQRVESMTEELYVSTGIILKTKERSPDTNLQEAKQKVSQGDVDALMEQLNQG